MRLEVPKGIDISVHTTSALLKADALEQDNILISAFSGRTELGTVTAENIDLSSSSGAIRAGGGAELSYTSGSGKLFTERSFTRRGALYVFGSGECRLTVETSSGNLEIR